jgi:hypothetical protein
MTCTRCETTGFLNIDQVSEDVRKQFDETGGHEVILKWMRENTGHDVSVCDCCGNGETWYGTPGEHYHDSDPTGPNGPYASNGGLCKCH